MNEDDLRKASEMVLEYHQEKAVTTNGHNLGTVEAQVAQVEAEGKPVVH